MPLKKVFVLYVAAVAGCMTSPLAAQQSTSSPYLKGAGTWPNFAIYRPSKVAPVDLADSPRIGSLIRDGKL